MIDRFQGAALATRLQIPLIYGVDSVHGDNNILGATVFPHNIGMGATRDPALVRSRSGAITADRDARDRPAVGVRAVHLRRARRALGPHVRELRRGPGARRADGDRDRRPPGRARPARGPRRVLATAKHFAGDGDTTYGTSTTGGYKIDQGITGHQPRDFWNTLASRRTCRPCRSTTSARVMPSYSSVDWTEDGVGNPMKMHANARADHRRAEEQDGLRAAS